MRPASITREQRCAAAYQYRVDSQSVLVDEGQLRCLDGEPSDGSWP